ncbi:hypothetical protein E5347_12335 [Clostridium sartagoforme]|uniref:Uncharacterized protein n=1 Tax=Clostridium sartagoforme TaxID=84031 RepID=A0A4S2DKP0_9CLOT|nr:hypothetical protein [Clostridium sartagoforme]TGY41511.1 hypothetical protein E5347_12335 [Clostridium sartagoforme]
MFNIIFHVTWLLIIVFGLFMIVRDKKSDNIRKNEELKNNITKKDKRVVYIIIFSTVFGYYILSYLLDLDILNFITFRENGITFSFVGLILLVSTSLIIGLIYEKLKNKRIENNN